MKKLFLVALMTIAFICVFSLSVSAADTNEFGTPETIEGIDLTDMNTDGDARVVLVESDGVTYHTYPSNYIVTNSKTLTFDFSRITTATYTKDSIVRFELPKGVTAISGSVIGSKTGLVEVVLGNDLTTIAKEVFSGYSALSKITLGNNLEEIGRYAFNGTSITEIVIPNSVTTIDVYAFAGCRSLVNATLSENITAIPEGAFSSCHYLVITIPDNVETIGDNAFNSACYYSGSITTKETSKLKSIGYRAFYDTQKVQGSLYMPSSLETIGSGAFANSSFSGYTNLENTKVTVLESDTFYTTAYTELRLPKNLMEIKSNAIFFVNKVYVPKTVKTVDSNAFYTPWKSGMVIFTGNSADLLKTCTKLAEATVIEASEYDETASYSGFNIVINYNSCKAFNNGIHSLNPNTASVVYSKGYLASGIYSVDCTACGEKQSEELFPLFECSGCSAPESGNGGIAIGFKVDTTAVAEYERLTKRSVKYGVFAALNDKLGGSDVFGADGTAAHGVISAEIVNKEFTSFELKIVGFSTDEHRKAKLVMGAYVAVTNGNTTEYSYMQDDSKGEYTGKYYVASYNNIVGASN